MAVRHIGGYWQSVVRHYELKGTHVQTMKGYESYAPMQAAMNQPGGVDAMVEFFLGLQIWGTPQQCFDKITACTDRCGGDTFTGVSATATCRSTTPRGACASSPRRGHAGAEDLPAAAGRRRVGCLSPFATDGGRSYRWPMHDKPPGRTSGETL